MRFRLAGWGVVAVGVGLTGCCLTDLTVRGAVPVVPLPRFAAQVTAGGILLPEAATKAPNVGTVVAVGDGMKNMEGATIPTSVSEGDKVLLPDFGGQTIDIDGDEFFLFRDSDILGKYLD